MSEESKGHILMASFDVATGFDLGALRLQAENWGKVLERSPLFVEFNQRQNRYLLIFEYGSVVFVGFSLEDAKLRLKEIKKYAVMANRREFTDSFVLHVGQGEGEATTEELFVEEATPDVIKLAAIALSRSVSLEYYEDVIDHILGDLEKPVEKLTQGTFSLKPGYYLRQFGSVLAINLELAYNLQLLDEPDVIWKTSGMEPLYKQMTTLFSLQERAQSVGHKLKIIRELSEFALAQFQHRSAKYRDMVIIGLFILETLVLVAVSLLPWFDLVVRTKSV